MKSKLFVLVFMLIAVNVYAANGDLVVEGNMGVLQPGATTPQGKMQITRTGLDYVYQTTVDGSLTPKCACDTNFAYADCAAEFGTTDAIGTVCYDQYLNTSTYTYKSKKYVVEQANAFYVSPVGDIGIGTRLPSTKLDVQGSEFVSGNLNVSGALGVSGNTIVQKLHANGDLEVLGYINYQQRDCVLAQGAGANSYAICAAGYYAAGIHFSSANVVDGVYCCR